MINTGLAEVSAFLKKSDAIFELKIRFGSEGRTSLTERRFQLSRATG